jgi:hypothetical protein
VQHRDVSAHAFFPAYENAAKSIHPAWSSLYYPTPRFEFSSPLELLCFFATRADMVRKAELIE